MTTDAGRTRARDYGSGRPPAINIAAAATASNPPAGGTGQNAGGWSGSSDRNDGIGSLIAAIADMNTLRTQLIALGIVDGSASDEGRVRARDIGSGKTPVRAVSVTVTASNPPAGGTGHGAGRTGAGARHDRGPTRKGRAAGARSRLRAGHLSCRLYRVAALRRCQRRCGDQQWRDQPLRRQGQGVCRGGAGAAPR